MRFVEKIYPYNSEVVERDITIDVRFFVDVDADTINNNNIILFDTINQNVVSTDISYQKRRMTIKPIESLQPNGQYELILKDGPTGLKDIIGLEMPAAYKSGFRTKVLENLSPPAIISPINRTIVDAPVKIKISPSSGGVYYQIQISASNRFDNILWPPNSELFVAEEEVELVPDFKWDDNNYFIRVRSTDGEELVSEFGPITQIYVNAAEEPVIIPPIEVPIEEPIGDEGEGEQIDLDLINDMLEESKIEEPFTEFKVLSSSPDDGEINVSVDNLGRIILKFSSNLDEATINEKSVYVVKEKN